MDSALRLLRLISPEDHGRALYALAQLLEPAQWAALAARTERPAEALLDVEAGKYFVCCDYNVATAPAAAGGGRSVAFRSPWSNQLFPAPTANAAAVPAPEGGLRELEILFNEVYAQYCRGALPNAVTSVYLWAEPGGARFSCAFAALKEHYFQEKRRAAGGGAGGGVSAPAAAAGSAAAAAGSAAGGSAAVAGGGSAASWTVLHSLQAAPAANGIKYLLHSTLTVAVKFGAPGAGAASGRCRAAVSFRLTAINERVERVGARGAKSAQSLAAPAGPASDPAAVAAAAHAHLELIGPLIELADADLRRRVAALLAPRLRSLVPLVRQQPEFGAAAPAQPVVPEVVLEVEAS